MTVQGEQRINMKRTTRQHKKSSTSMREEKIVQQCEKSNVVAQE
jgi:hypothetical protein